MINKDNSNIEKYSCDVTWFELQKKDRWYIIEPLMVKGDRVYSDESKIPPYCWHALYIIVVC